MVHDLSIPDDAPWPFSLRDLTPRQRIGLGAAAIIVLVGLCGSLWSRSSSDLVPLSTQEPLTPSAARELEATFRQAGLTQFERDGQEIFVPRSQLDRYTALLLRQSSTADNWASEWERQNDRLTPFSSSRARETTREIARAKLITGMLQKLPDVQQADVVWDEDEQRGWRASPKARATVYLMPQPDRILTLDVVRSVRLAVAGSKKNLDPADVVVLDLARQITYEGPLPAAAGDELLPALRSLAELYRREITQHVSELSDAAVDVSVDLPRFFTFLAEHPETAEQQLSAAAPGLLRAGITIPADSGLSPHNDSQRVQTQRKLRSRIATLTGIGGDNATGEERVVIAFERTASAPQTTPKPAFTFAGWPKFDNWKSPAVVLGGVLLIGIWLLIVCRRSLSRRPCPPMPVLHNVGGTSRQNGLAGSLLEFDDLSQLDVASLRSVYPHATPRRWAVALRGSSRDLREHLAAALNSADADELRQQCDQLGPVTVGDIESSRRRILDSARPTTNFTPS